MLTDSLHADKRVDDAIAEFKKSHQEFADFLARGRVGVPEFDGEIKHYAFHLHFERTVDVEMSNSCDFCAILEFSASAIERRGETGRTIKQSVPNANSIPGNTDKIENVENS